MDKEVLLKNIVEDLRKDKINLTKDKDFLFKQIERLTNENFKLNDENEKNLKEKECLSNYEKENKRLQDQ